MQNINKHSVLFIGAIAAFYWHTTQAATPVWTFSAPTPASLTLFDGETATLQYVITNQSANLKI